MSRWLSLAVVLSGCASTFTTKGLIERAPAGVTEQAGAPRRFALLVGIDAFDDAHFTPLRFAGADARAMAAALSGYQSVRVLTGRDDTLKASILSALEEIGREATHPQDTVVVYISSHGTLGRRPGGPLARMIVARDTRLELLADTGLQVERVKALLEAMPARRKALVLALCHSGKGKSALDDSLSAQLAATKGPPATFHEVSEGLMVLTACAFGETARESEALGHDVYTHGLLTALGRGDRDGDGAVTALEAHDFARDATWAATNGEQRPTAEVELVGRDPVVLVGEVVRTSAPVLFSYAPAAEGLRLRVDGAVKGVLPGGVTLAPGRREVSIEEARSGAVLAKTTVVLAAGDRLDVSEVLPPSPAWQLGLEARAVIVTNDAVRARAVPPAFGARAWLMRRLGASSIGAGVGYLTGLGSLPGLDETIPFTSHVIEPSLTARWAPWPRVGLSLGGEVGWAVIVRDAATRDFRSVQVVGAPLAAVSVGWERRVFQALLLGVALRGGALAVSLERTLAVSPFVGLSLSIGWTER